VIEAPFHADPTVAQRLAELTLRVGPAVEADVEGIVAPPPRDPLDASTIGAAAVAELVARHGLDSAADLALLALPVAASMARPPISGYRVGAIAIEAETGDLVLGANLEFRGTDLATTVHAEGFVALRARRRGRTLATLAIREAHPCAHCRQTLAESSGADGLTLIDPLGHTLGLWELYPWPFRPSALGVDGDTPARDTWPGLAFVDPPSAGDAGEALLGAGSRAHAPYSGAPSAVALRLRDGRWVTAGCVESVAFNPSISALQAALVEVAAARVEPEEIVEGWLAKTDGGPVDPEPGFRALLRAVAPSASAQVARWRVAG
jgi:cytidine deaminase